MTPKVSSPRKMEDFKEEALKKRGQKQIWVTICGSTGCQASGGDEVAEAFKREIDKADLGAKVGVTRSGCHGFCEQGPVVVIHPQEIFYPQIDPEDVPEIVFQTLLKNKVVEHVLYVDPATGRKINIDPEVPFYQKQKRIVLSDNGIIDPTEISDYLARGGYEALKKVLSVLTPEQVIGEIEKSNLRGRGGAGFPTGKKWRICREAPGEVKYLICNGDEGDPGAFMDRSVLEGNPHRVIEGMIIAGYAIGAKEGYVYVRAEYPLAVKHLKIALSQAKELGILGENILGSGFSFEIKVAEGAGAFVCGEETALMDSVEGKRGMPRMRPPYPAQAGLWGFPTNINNVETYANIPLIILKGAQWYASLGTERSGGTKIFSLTGKINNTGLVEVPVGTSLRKVIFDIGGAIPKGRKFKAVQMGGPSGGCVPEKFLDLPIDYDTLQEVGAIMGSGGMIVMDENTCMVEIARFFMDFCQSESCGKCVPCRIGTRRMLEILTRITQGEGKEEDLEQLEHLGEMVKKASLCGLGQTAPNPLLSTLKYFEGEYRSHIEDKRCPAAQCEALMKAPCQTACPAGVDAVSYIALIAHGRYKQALAVHKERNPFPSVCGRACDHPCEVRCRRGEIDEPIAIAHLKRFMADQETDAFETMAEPLPDKGKKAAVIGSGPAGLSCAYHLTLSGYEVTCFEALPEVGGMLTVGIPAYRLPQKEVTKEIEALKKLGVKIKTNSRLGGDITLESLFGQGYEAVFLSLGAHLGQRLNIPGEDSAGVFEGVSFLKEVNLGKKPSFGPKVAVVGGGNVAIDAARSVLRLGAKEVTILYRRSKEEMPAYSWDIKEAQEEGIKFIYLASPIAILKRNGQVSGAKCQQMKLGKRDESGRRRPLPIEGSEFEMEANTVITAIGQFPEASFLSPELEITKQGTIRVDKNFMTSKPGVFAGGDTIPGPRSIVHAIGQGQKAAFAIDKYLSGSAQWEKEIVRREKERRVAPFPSEESREEKREIMGELLPKERSQSFTEVLLGFSKEQARREARRCLRCDLE